MLHKNQMNTTLRNILDGAKTIINLFPSPELPKPQRIGRYGYDPKRTDAEALASDWQAVGNDLRKAMGMVNREIKQTHR